MDRSYCVRVSMTEKSWNTAFEKLSEYAPVLQSVSVVPVGLTKYREGLYPLEPFNKEDAKEVLGQIRTLAEDHV